jgi:hypothetical protein
MKSDPQAPGESAGSSDITIGPYPRETRPIPVAEVRGKLRTHPMRSKRQIIAGPAKSRRRLRPTLSTRYVDVVNPRTRIKL